MNTGKLNLNYHSQLDELFEEWKQESLKYDEPREPIENGRIIFTDDGLVEKSDELKIDVEKEWRKSDKRVMFILKDQPSEWCNDARLWLKTPENRELKSKFIHNIANIFGDCTMLTENTFVLVRKCKICSMKSRNVSTPNHLLLWKARSREGRLTFQTVR